MKKKSAMPGDRHVSASESYAQLVTDAQSALYAYICSLLGGSHSARDVLQETNLVLWRKASEFDAGREFLPWAFRFAFLQVMAYRKRQSLDRHVFSQAALEAIADRAASAARPAGAWLETLDDCVDRLTGHTRRWVALRYEQGNTVRSIARQESKPEGTVAAALFRARKFLADCVKSELVKESLS